MKELKLDGWLPEAQLLVRIFSQLFASHTNDLSEWLSDMREENNLSALFGTSDLESWLHMYRSQKKLLRYLVRAMMSLGGMPTVYAQISEALEGRLVHARVESKMGKSKGLTIEELQRYHSQYLKEDAANMPVSEEQRQTVVNTLLTQSFHFLSKVALPCLIIYRDNYILLYRKARLGHIPSLDKLLRIDKILIRDPSINKWFHFYSGGATNKRNFEVLIEALRSPPKPRLSQQQAKIRMAGIISVFSQLLGHRLTAPEIQKLFDAVAVDYGHDELRDDDLPDAPEAFSQALRRERNILLAKLNTPTKLS